MKNFSAFTGFLYYTGFGMLMNGYYKESVKLFEKNWLFINKYRQYMSKTAKAQQVKKLKDKLLKCTAVAQLFYPMKVDPLLEYQIRQYLNRNLDPEDTESKYDKLKRHDPKTIMDCLNGTPKVFIPIKDHAHFMSMETVSKANEDQFDVTRKQREGIVGALEGLKKFSDLAALLKLYNVVSYAKLGKLFKMKKKQAQLDFGSTAPSGPSTPFDSGALDKEDREFIYNLVNEFLAFRGLNFNNESALHKTVLKHLFYDVKETEYKELGQDTKSKTGPNNTLRISVREPEAEKVDYAEEYNRCIGQVESFGE
jgi:hypothetical protein